jgi:hypothetical protein
MMALASVIASGQGATERLLADVVARLRVDGVRMVGALRTVPTTGGTGHCNGDLYLLPNGPVVRITQNLGAGSVACRMDAGALEEVVEMLTKQLQEGGADLVILNKFGLSEAEGRGFRALIAEALECGLPVLTGLSETHRAAFERFAEGMTIHLPPEEDVVLRWCRQEILRSATMLEEV